MASEAKYVPVNAGGTHSDVKSLFSVFKTRKPTTLAYGFMVAFVAFTVFLAFSPSPNSSSPWFSNIFSLPAAESTSPSDSYRSQFSSFFSHFFPDASSPEPAPANSVPAVESESNRSDDVKPRPPTSGNLDLVAENDTSSAPRSNPSDPSFQNGTAQSPSIAKSNPVVKNSTSHSPSADKLEPVPKNRTSDRTVASNEPPESNPRAPNSEASKSAVAKEQPSISVNQTLTHQHPDSKPNKTISPAGKSPSPAKQSDVTDSPNTSANTSSLKNEQSNGADSRAKQGIESLRKCDLFDGKWVMDESYPLYKPGSCSLIDEQFNCIANGRPDKDFQKLKWKPKGCTLPRLDGAHMLEMLRGKRLVFVGDSLNRNMWESLVCILKGSAKNEKNVYEAHGRHYFRGEAEYSFVFKDYDCTVEFFVSPFLVQEWENVDKNGTKKETLRLDLVGRTSERYKGADILVFNTGHWWTHEKTAKGKDYYQEGSHVYSELNVLEAFRKALTTWGRWIDAHVNPARTIVFFRGYSASHFSGGQWNSGGACDSETEPISNDKYLTPYPSKMQTLEKVLRGMKTPVIYLNITRLTDYRKDGHPSIYRKLKVPEEERRAPLRFQDCSHWCLPGVPDSWNEILYAELLLRLNPGR